MFLLSPGVDGVGVLEDGCRVYFGGTVSRGEHWPKLRWRHDPHCLLPLPDGLEDVQGAAIANPGMSAWLTLKERGQVAKAETVLVPGATGVTGQIALQVARCQRAKRVIDAGLNVDAIAVQSVDGVISLGQLEELKVAVAPVPLADIEGAWSRSEKGRRIVFTVEKMPDLSGCAPPTSVTGNTSWGVRCLRE